MSRTRPHILFIVLDTLRRDHLSAYGYPRETSPELQAFAAQAAQFERAVAPAQWTIPSHASMFTGLYPSTHGLTQASGVLTGAYPALAELLRGAGYHTAAFCNNPLVGVLNNGLQRGFDRFYNYASAAPFRPVEARRSRVQRETLRLFRRYVARPLGNQFAQSDFLFRASLNPALVPLWTRLINYKGHTGHSVDDLIAYWDQHTDSASERPLFAFLNLMGAHLPYNPPQDALDRLSPEVRRDRAAYAFVRRFNTEGERWASPTDPPLADWERAALDHFYDAEIAHQDAHLGRLLRHLKARGVLENTLVIICADHGEGHGDHGFFGHGFVTYQELVHVPLIVRYPEQYPVGGRVTATVSTRRLFHSVLDAAGVPFAEEDDPTATARALSLANETSGLDPEGGVALSEAFPPLTFLNVVQHRAPALIERLRLSLVRRALYAGGHKLTAIDGQVEGLFDVGADPTESHDLSAADPARAADLLRMLDQRVTAAAGRHADGEAAQAAAPDQAVIDHLRALGYIE